MAAASVRLRERRMRQVLIGLIILIGATQAHAGNPRWVTGPPFFRGSGGVSIGWYTSTPMYFTDPGDLSAYVNHAAADALVAAASSVWNVPTAHITVSYGGALSEHVSAANAYLTATGPVFPADLLSSNYVAKQIAIIYDSDGSVTDMLLGGGASDPAECRQNAVTENVDLFDPAGYIDHALLILNGRCTGPAPEQQLQLQYQLERAFGRILGVGWSQTNDNVFTEVPQPTGTQANHWPIMHPIDVICGAYTYQCMPQAFTLRDDDVSAITSIYPMLAYDIDKLPPPAVGKIWSFLRASQVFGTIAFPGGQGMQGVNVLARRIPYNSNIHEDFSDVSGVSGFRYQRNAGNPITGAPPGLAGTMGAADFQGQAATEGAFELYWIPEIDNYVIALNAFITTEPINPLYRGAYAVGPYTDGPVTPSGTPQTNYIVGAYPLIDPFFTVFTNFEPVDAAAACTAASDGTEAAPVAASSTGFWSGTLCGHGHTAWTQWSARPGHTATLEVTALDDSGFASTSKANPMIGLWGAADPQGTLPTLAASAVPFNSSSLGMTSLAVTSSGNIRMAIADARGDGRPDFAYRARLLYADSVQPASVDGNGGTITITGSGFRAGNEVLVNNVPASVISWTATSIVAVAPSASVIRATAVGAVDVRVVDLSTHGSTNMAAALTYTSVAPDIMTVVSAPEAVVPVNVAAKLPFSVRVTLPDGITPAVGLPISFQTTAGNALLGSCVALCGVSTVSTDATGLATITVTPTAYGNVTIQAATLGLAQAVSFNALLRAVAIAQATEYVVAGATVAWTPQISAVENAAPAAGVAVSWSLGTGLQASSISALTDGSGNARLPLTVGPLAAGTQASGAACAWVILCVNFSAIAVDATALRLAIVSGGGQTIALAATFAPVVLVVTDDQGHPVAGADVTIHQTMDASHPPCPAHGRCPAVPVVAATNASVVSDPGGLVSFTPSQSATGGTTNVAVATGAQGFVSLSLQQGP